MIQKETRGNFIYTYSDAGMMIYGGMPEAYYIDAYDPIDSERSFIETDISIGEADEADFIEALEDLGVNLNEEE